MLLLRQKGLAGRRRLIDGGERKPTELRVGELELTIEPAMTNDGPLCLSDEAQWIDGREEIRLR